MKAMDPTRACCNCLAREASGGARRIAVALSGGPDSVALLHALVHNRFPTAPRLIALHIDHGVRADAAEDAAFCARLAADLSLPFRVLRADPSRVWRSGRASEARLRQERYRLLRQALAQFGAERLLVAHHLDDQLESIVLAALRGAGLKGLRGMPRRRPLTHGSRGGPLLVRPLLRVRRADLLAYLARHGLTYRTDPTNFDLTYLRNRVRHVLLPTLRRDLGPRFDHRLARLGRLATLLWRRATGDPRPAHLASTDALHARLEQAARTALPARQSRAMQAMLAGGGSAVYSVSSDTQIRVTGGEVRRCIPAPPSPPATIRTRQHAHASRLLRAIAALPPHDRRRRLEGRGRHYLDADRVRGPLCVRTRLPGDRYQPLGLAQPRRLKGLLIARQIPSARRDDLAVFQSRDCIVAIEGLPPSQGAALTPESRTVLRIVVRRAGDSR